MNRMSRYYTKIQKAVLTVASVLFAVMLAGCTPEAQQFADAVARLQEAQQTQIAIEQEGTVPSADNEIERAIAEAEQESGISPQEEEEAAPAEEQAVSTEEYAVKEGAYYYDLQNVVLYLDCYHRLPDNYITKNEARDLGWEGGSVEDYCEGAAIGGDRFGNREGVLPQNGKTVYFECDIDTHGWKNRGSRRLIYTKDGEYFYSPDHYETYRKVTIRPDRTVELDDTILK